MSFVFFAVWTLVNVTLPITRLTLLQKEVKNDDTTLKNKGKKKKSKCRLL